MVIWNAIVKWFYGFCGVDIIMDAISKNEPVPVQGYVQLVFSGLLAVLGILSCYRVFYFILGVFGRSRRYPEAPKDKRYAFIVAAWNEEAVIGNLIRDIRALDYPQELIEIFIVADNCTDKTGEVAEKLGAHVYYRNDKSKRAKGYALQSLIEPMSKDYDNQKDI